MAKCWTCGNSVSGWKYKCSACREIKELSNLQKKVESFHGDISDRLRYMTEVQKEGLDTLIREVTYGLSNIASAIEWGFGELSWQIQQQTNILQSIDKTLKTPSETQANEWRIMAEELRRRSVLVESEEFYQKALNLNRLDYRIYVGLAETHLQMNKFDKAKVFLEKSLPHAPKEFIDYKSYSLRLVGHIFACEENYKQAKSVLKSATDLSPEYEQGHYDYAQYCAQEKDIKNCLPSLQKAILLNPFYLYLAQNEQNFNPFRDEVEKLISQRIIEVNQQVKDEIREVESILKENKENFNRSVHKAWEMVLNAEEALNKSKIDGTLKSTEKYDDAKNQFNQIYDKANSALQSANEKLATQDYIKSLEAKKNTSNAIELATGLKNKMEGLVEGVISEAKKEMEYYKSRRKEKIGNAWRRVPASLIGLPILLGIIGGIGGCTIGLFIHASSKGSDVGLFLGIIIGFIIGIYRISKEL